MSDAGITWLDGSVLAVMLVAMGRGAWIGMIRESFSIAALGISCIALRYGNPAASQWLSDLTGGEIGTGAAPFLTGAAIVLGTVALVSLLGRSLKKGAEAAGLGWADRVGGGVVGFAEGALASTLIVMGATLLLGQEHHTIQDSRSVEVVESLQQYVAANYPEQLERLPDVAAPRRR